VQKTKTKLRTAVFLQNQSHFCQQHSRICQKSYRWPLKELRTKAVAEVTTEQDPSFEHCGKGQSESQFHN